jgi:uncharacterized protein YecT (DUF1311 family)
MTAALIAAMCACSNKNGITMTLIPNGQVALSISGFGDATIDWGDGSKPEVIMISAESGDWYLHQYSIYNETAITISITGNEIIELICGEQNITTLDVSRNIELMRLYCERNQLTELDVSHNPMLTKLSCYANQLKTLDLSYNINLEHLWCNNNELTALNVNVNTKLSILHCFNNLLTALNVTNNPKLENLHCENNQLTELDVRNNPALTELYCGNNQLTELDLSGNPELEYLNSDDNPFSMNDKHNGDYAKNKHPIDLQMERDIDENSSTVGMFEAYTNANEAWEAEINKYYEEMMLLLDPDCSKKLQAAQKAWLAFKTDEMTFNAAYWGMYSGSLYSTFSPYYRLYLSRNRAFELASYFKKDYYDYSSYFDEDTDIRSEEDWDYILNDSYKLLIEQLTKDHKDRLRTAQRKWITYRDAEAECYNSCNMLINNADHKLMIIRERALRLGKYQEDLNDIFYQEELENNR